MAHLCTCKAGTERLLLEVLRKRPAHHARIKGTPTIWEPRRVLSVKGAAGTDHAGEIDMRTFVAGETKIDVIAHIRKT